MSLKSVLKPLSKAKRRFFIIRNMSHRQRSIVSQSAPCTDKYTHPDAHSVALLLNMIFHCLFPQADFLA